MSDKPVRNRLEVINRIKEWIDTGELLPNSPMPTEREISKRLSIQRLTVSRALATLEKDGIVKRIGRRTRVVAERQRLLENSIVLMNTSKFHTLRSQMHMPGWSVMMCVGALEEISERNYNVVLIHPERMTARQLENLIKGRPLGVIFPEFDNFTDRGLWCASLKQAGIHVVTYGDDPDACLYDHVTSDHEEGSYQLTRYMLQQGCRNPLMFYCVAYPKYWAIARYAGYKRAMTEAGLEALPFVTFPPTPFVAPPGTFEQFDACRRHTLSYLIDHIGPNLGKAQKIDALLLATDGQLFPTSAACRTLGLVPGKDIMLAGYDNYWSECWERKFEEVNVAATTDKHNIEAGKLMVHLLLERTAGRLDLTPYKKVVESELIPLLPGKAQKK